MSPTLIIPNVYTYKQKPIPSSSLNDNMSAVKAVINALDIDNVDAGATDKILVNTEDELVSGDYSFSGSVEFLGDVSFLSDSIPSDALEADVAVLGTGKDISNKQTFTGIKEFTEPINIVRLPTYSSHPTTAPFDTSMYLYSGDGKAYIYKHPAGAERIDIFTLTPAGTIRTYSDTNATDENTPIIIPFKVEGVGAGNNVSIQLWGRDFPSYIYTELPQHTHEHSLTLADGTVANENHTHTTDIGHTHAGNFGSSTHTHAGGSHSHTVSSHSHGFTTGSNSRNHIHSMNFNSALEDDHDHSYGADGNGSPFTTAEAGGHLHTITGDTAGESQDHTHGGTTDGTGLTTNTGGTANTGTPSASASVTSHVGFSESSNESTYISSVGTEINGTITNAGILGNGLNDTKKVNVTSNIKIYITADRSNWGTGYDSGTYAGLANINTPAGTGSIDIKSLCSAGMNFVKIIDETVKTGGTIDHHIETE